ncbi:MAG: NADH-quinone oxidoreductase subunit J [Nitratireductor sp.]|nr:NADH-quinone oxidoreductase subunit J [Nitratireductor sp.]
MGSTGILPAIFFYVFATITVASAFMVIASRNPVHSVLFLILAFVNAAGLFMLAGAEFLAMLLIVVYVGAVAVLFLFVVMMLDVDFAELRDGFLQYLPVGGLIGLIVLIELLAVAGGWVLAPGAAGDAVEAVPDMAETSNIMALGDILYTRYVVFFQISGLILLVAMIGAIVLTLRHKPNVRRQDITRQVARTPETAIEIVKVESGKGI